MLVEIEQKICGFGDTVVEVGNHALQHDLGVVAGRYIVGNDFIDACVVVRSARDDDAVCGVNAVLDRLLVGVVLHLVAYRNPGILRRHPGNFGCTIAAKAAYLRSSAR